MNDVRFSFGDSGHLSGMKFKISLLCALALAGIGCNQATDTAPQSDSKVTGQPPEAAKSLGTADDPFADVRIKREDISDSAASVISPITVLGKGPQYQLDPLTLNSLRNSFLAQGNPMRAKKVEISYDLKTGAYKGSEASLQSGVPLAKAATWTPSDVFFRVGFKTTWSSYIPNGNWGGASTSNSDTLTYPRIYGFNPVTVVQNGVTPSLYFRVKWKGSTSWTAARSWNEAHSTVGGNPAQWMQAFGAYSTYSSYNVCYTVFVVQLVNNNYTYYPDTECNGMPVSPPQTDKLWFTGINFSVLTQ